MSRREPYRGYVIQGDPARRRGRWRARVVIELHQGGSVHYQEVEADPFRTYATKTEAVRASIDFGRAILDSRPLVPADA